MNDMQYGFSRQQVLNDKAEILCESGRFRRICFCVFACAAVACFTSYFPKNALAQGKGIEARQTKNLFDLLDTNRDGNISVSEFKNNQMLIFYIWDNNKDLLLTPNETPLPPDVFMRVAGQNSRIDTMEFMNVVDSAFEQADVNRDGVLTLDEFTKMRQFVRHQ
ncbi:MAG: EF-hand domain-containing protein [Alphaproteobacteria bacterium]